MRNAHPWLGFLVGLILGIAVAVILQQAGIWPLDQILVFIALGVFAFLGSWLGRLGRTSSSAFSTFAPLVLAVAMIAYGAVGFGDINQHGNINGGCQAAAQSAVDTTDVFDTSRQDPFDIDPDASLEWVSTSPAPIMDHNWGIYVEFAGFDILIDSGSHPNEGGSEISSGQVDDLTSYIKTVTTISGQPLLGTFIVSGDISVGATVICDGFGFVRLTSDNPFESLVAKIAGGLALLALLTLATLILRRGGPGASGADEDLLGGVTEPVDSGIWPEHPSTTDDGTGAGGVAAAGSGIAPPGADRDDDSAGDQDGGDGSDSNGPG